MRAAGSGVGLRDPAAYTLRASRNCARVSGYAAGSLSADPVARGPRIWHCARFRLTPLARGPRDRREQCALGAPTHRNMAGRGWLPAEAARAVARDRRAVRAGLAACKAQAAEAGSLPRPRKLR